MKYVLTNDTKTDLRNIYKFGLEQFGLRQADIYLDDIYAVFDEIARRPLSYPSAIVGNTLYRRALYKVQSIYFRIYSLRDEVVIVRVLGRQDPQISFG